MLLTLNQDEVSMCIKILDFYFRIFIGQYNEIEWVLSWYMGYQFNEDNKMLRNHYYLKLRGILIPKLASENLNGSLGIWSNFTDIRAINAYDILQVIRYKNAWYRTPEGGIGVDFDLPCMKGSLPKVECSCYGYKNKASMNITINSEHLRILKDAAIAYKALIEVRIRDLFQLYTDNEIALELAQHIESLYIEEKRDYSKTVINELQSLTEKVFTF